MESLNRLTPIISTGVKLSVDELFDEDEIPLLTEEIYWPWEFFLPSLRKQLKEKNLRLLEVFLDKGSMSGENAILLCVLDDEEIINNLNVHLKKFGLLFSRVVPSVFC